MTKFTITVTEAEHATILAALRFYQEKGQGDPCNRSDAIHEIATNGGEHLWSSLDDAQIDKLCEKINFDAIDINTAALAEEDDGE